MSTTLADPLENAVVNLEMLSASCSQSKGFSAILERDVRLMCCNIIDSATILLDLHQVTSATAQVLIQRFFFKVSIGDFPLLAVMGAALYLACKLEEQPRRLRDIITVLDYLKRRANRQPEALLDISSNTYFNLREGVLEVEITLLSKLGFNVHVEHPHGFLLNYLSSLELADNHEFCQLALNYLHDSYRTIAFCLYQPPIIAASVVFLAARNMNVLLVEDEEHPWYKVFDAELADLELVSLLILELYNIKKILNVVPSKLQPDALPKGSSQNGSAGSINE